MSVTILAVANTPVRSMDLPSYISGYVDGEGCFNVSFCRRAAMRTGWDVRPSFSVSQNDDRQEVLELMLDYFGCGTLRPDRSDNTVKFEVRAIANLIDRGGAAFRGVSVGVSEAKRLRRFRSGVPAGRSR